MASYLRMRERGQAPRKEKKRSKDYSFNFDIDKMKEAIESPSITIPEGLNREELIELLNNRTIG